MPTPFEQELLAMAAAQRQQSETVESGPALPDLHPEMLLSSSAKQEFEAARSLRGNYRMDMAHDLSDAADHARRARELAPRPTRQVQAAEPDFFETGSDDFELTDQDLAPTYGRPVTASGSDIDALTSLFMNNREAQDALNVTGGVSSVGGGGYDIAFDMDAGDAFQGSPNESARWRVGREDPPPSNFVRSAPRSGPSDGVVVSSRGQSGSWESRPLPAPRPDVRQAQVTRHEAAARQAQASRPAPVPVQRTSRYDLITSDD